MHPAVVLATTAGGSTFSITGLLIIVLIIVAIVALIIWIAKRR